MHRTPQGPNQLMSQQKLKQTTVHPSSTALTLVLGIEKKINTEKKEEPDSKKNPSPNPPGQTKTHRLHPVPSDQLIFPARPNPIHLPIHPNPSKNPLISLPRRELVCYVLSPSHFPAPTTALPDPLLFLLGFTSVENGLTAVPSLNHLSRLGIIPPPPLLVLLPPLLTLPPCCC